LDPGYDISSPCLLGRPARDPRVPVTVACVPLLLAEDATALTNLGDVHVGLGRHAAAVTFYEQALALFGDLGERYGET
jgi:hypothetical protein